VHVYKVRPRNNKRGLDLISDALPFGRLWYAWANATATQCKIGNHKSKIVKIVAELGSSICVALVSTF